MKHKLFTRRDFIKTSFGASIAIATGCPFLDNKPAVSIVKIKDGKIDYAVKKAIDLLGGINTVAKGKNSIMLKPNLVAESPGFTTKPTVIKALAKLMKTPERKY